MYYEVENEKSSTGVQEVGSSIGTALLFAKKIMIKGNK